MRFNSLLIFVGKITLSWWSFSDKYIKSNGGHLLLPLHGDFFQTSRCIQVLLGTLKKFQIFNPLLKSATCRKIAKPYLFQLSQHPPKYWTKHLLYYSSETYARIWLKFCPTCPASNSALIHPHPWPCEWCRGDLDPLDALWPSAAHMLVTNVNIPCTKESSRGIS